jgi:hypothetical protein
MEAGCFSIMSVNVCHTAWHLIPEDYNLYRHHSENLNPVYYAEPSSLFVSLELVVLHCGQCDLFEWFTDGVM